MNKTIIFIIVFIILFIPFALSITYDEKGISYRHCINKGHSAKDCALIYQQTPH